MKRTFNERLKDRYSRETSTPSKPWHSSAYHRYFEGYTEREVVNEKGKVKIQRVYIGDWYVRDLDKKQRILLPVMLFLMLAAASALFVICAVQTIPANMTWYTAVCQFAAGMCLAWNLVAWIEYIASPRKMTIGDYNSSTVRFRRSSIASVGALFLCALVLVICAFIYPEYIGAHLLCALGCGIGGGLMFVSNRIEKNVPYKIIPNSAEPDSDSVYID